MCIRAVVSFQHQISSALFICFVVYNQTFELTPSALAPFLAFPLKCETFEFCYYNRVLQMFDMCPDLLRCLSRVLGLLCLCELKL